MLDFEKLAELFPRNREFVDRGEVFAFIEEEPLRHKVPVVVVPLQSGKLRLAGASDDAEVLYRLLRVARTFNAEAFVLNAQPSS
jgi:hypothetical protein